MSKQRPIVLIEILPVYTFENTSRWKRQQNIEEIFTALNYSLLRIVKDENSLQGLKEVENNRIGVHSDLNRCDYISAPSELLRIFEDINSQLTETNYEKTN